MCIFFWKRYLCCLPYCGSLFLPPAPVSCRIGLDAIFPYCIFCGECLSSWAVTQGQGLGICSYGSCCSVEWSGNTWGWVGLPVCQGRPLCQRGSNCLLSSLFFLIGMPGLAWHLCCRSLRIYWCPEYLQDVRVGLELGLAQLLPVMSLLKKPLHRKSRLNIGTVQVGWITSPTPSTSFGRWGAL